MQSIHFPLSLLLHLSTHSLLSSSVLIYQLPKSYPNSQTVHMPLPNLTQLALGVSQIHRGYPFMNNIYLLKQVCSLTRILRKYFQIELYNVRLLHYMMFFLIINIYTKITNISCLTFKACELKLNSLFIVYITVRNVLDTVTHLKLNIEYYINTRVHLCARNTFPALLV